MTREDVVQAALTLERWCRCHWKRNGACDCPLRDEMYDCKVSCLGGEPFLWNLDEFLRTRGMKHE